MGLYPEYQIFRNKNNLLAKGENMEHQIRILKRLFEFIFLALGGMYERHISMLGMPFKFLELNDFLSTFLHL